MAIGSLIDLGGNGVGVGVGHGHVHQLSGRPETFLFVDLSYGFHTCFMLTLLAFTDLFLALMGRSSTGVKVHGGGGGGDGGGSRRW